ncbi:MAG: flavin reductase family protein [Actinobacteria bacterium]|nr:flavin reductase family protein [Actinomycetota bacterium]
MGEFDSTKFRSVLGHVPTSVVVVTGLDASGAPHGVTIGSFASVSLDPPLVGFFPGVTSRSWAAIADSGRFAVNVLGSGQDEICWRFAKEGEDRFAGLEWRASALGSPLLAGSLAWIDCTVESVGPAGDHHFVVGRVESLEGSPGDAMVFFRGKVLSVHADS